MVLNVLNSLDFSSCHSLSFPPPLFFRIGTILILFPLFIELDNSKILNASRIARIARGSGRKLQEVNELMAQYKQFEKIIGNKSLKNPNNMRSIHFACFLACFIACFLAFHISLWQEKTWPIYYPLNSCNAWAGQARFSKWCAKCKVETWKCQKVSPDSLGLVRLQKGSLQISFLGDTKCLEYHFWSL